MDTTTCPECGAIAEVEWRVAVDSTDGPVEHAKVRCLLQHWFLLPVASLRGAPAGAVTALPRPTPTGGPCREGSLRSP